MTGSSGHSRPSGRSFGTWYHFDQVESCSRTFRGLCHRRKGDTPNHARNRTCHAAAVAVATISTLALGFCGSMTSEFINQSRLLEEVGHGSVAPAWDCSLPCGVQCVHSSVCNVSASGNVFYCSTSVGGRCFAT